VSGAAWPGGAGGALSLTFDNLGEAAEIELGAIPPDSPLGAHPTATEALPALLEKLGDRGLSATFFVEGLNAEVYPELLAEVHSKGHEVAYHAWRHEQWGDLTAAEQAANLVRGQAAFADLGLRMAGFRPPGGSLGAGGLEVLRAAGLTYCSPAGRGAGPEGGLAVLPFRWRDVDAACVLPGLESVREEIAGQAEPLDPGAYIAGLQAELERLAADGGYVATVLHPSMLGWLGDGGLGALLDRAAEAAAAEELWVAPCAAVADRILAAPGAFEGGFELDPRTWSG
jgi:peptidoglycan/xylan/chitin deacetylase (PgdA/CDA1 family)